MSLIDLLSNPDSWERFYEYRSSLAVKRAGMRELREFIDSRSYLPVCEKIDRCIETGEFPLPARSVISKLSTGKKRTVYTYPEAENTVLKLLTYFLLRQYDHIYSKNLYSFRPGRTAQDAVKHLLRQPGIFEKYSYKVDVSNYFNSIPAGEMIEDLEKAVGDDKALFSFLSALLSEDRVIDNATGEVVIEQKGIMAGTPLASFYADLYLREMDSEFETQGILYARYSDDIIVFADSPEELKLYAGRIRQFLASRGLEVNPSKEEVRTPGEGFVFLGFSLCNGVIDIAPASIDKLKKKMRRKTRALKRWQIRNGLDGVKAAKAFIRIFNAKLLESTSESDLSWSYWYFPNINTHKSLAVIDGYAQECLRFLLSSKRTKTRFNVRYEDLKKLGYKSLVHEYHLRREADADETVDIPMSY